jgi:YD repeat-containing protein
MRPSARLLLRRRRPDRPGLGRKSPALRFGDWRGNLRTQGTSVYTWDAANRLVGANVDGVASSFEYDGSGNRTAQTMDEVTTEYVLDVAGGLPEVIVATTGGASTRYVQVQGQVLGASRRRGICFRILGATKGGRRCLTPRLLRSIIRVRGRGIGYAEGIDRPAESVRR